MIEPNTIHETKPSPNNTLPRSGCPTRAATAAAMKPPAAVGRKYPACTDASGSGLYSHCPVNQAPTRTVTTINTSQTTRPTSVAYGYRPSAAASIGTITISDPNGPATGSVKSVTTPPGRDATDHP